GDSARDDADDRERDREVGERAHTPQQLLRVAETVQLMHIGVVDGLFLSALSNFLGNSGLFERHRCPPLLNGRSLPRRTSPSPARPHVASVIVAPLAPPR